METIILIRHGEGEHMVSDLTGGWSQVPLTENGRAQARAVASRLKRDLEGIDFAFYCSDIKRAHQTAEIIGCEIGVKPILSQGLREINNGVAADRTKAEVVHLYRPPSDPIMDWQAYPEAETWRRFYRRIKGVMDEIHAVEDRPTLIVSHGGTIVNLVAWWIRLDEAGAPSQTGAGPTSSRREKVPQPFLIHENLITCDENKEIFSPHHSVQ